MSLKSLNNDGTAVSNIAVGSTRVPEDARLGERFFEVDAGLGVESFTTEIGVLEDDVVCAARPGPRPSDRRSG